MLHRAKRTPGQFIMRLRVPNGIVNADQMRFYANSVAKYGDEMGVIDITTRANIVSISNKLFRHFGQMTLCVSHFSTIYPCFRLYQSSN
jgi:dissimilatory sulfite reductase (desulfoviridin) alpha/beta subunit